MCAEKEMIAPNRIPKVYPEALAAAQNPDATIEEIEFHMRELFYHPRLTLNMVVVYKRLERTWKILTEWVDNEANII
jgi:hypothetical protein